LALIAGGGEQTLIEIEGHLADRRPLLVLAGTGRAADDMTGRMPAAESVMVTDVGGVAHDGRWRLVLREEVGPH
jgi:hypothetical protein